jgi:Fe-S cluster biogenesis protein NfuA
METAVKSPVLIYTEQTPNPETLKFVTNRMVYQGTADFSDFDLAKEWSPLAKALFTFPYVKGVYICNNFVTITKEFNYEWSEIMLKLKEYIKSYMESGDVVINQGFEEVRAALASKNNASSYAEGDADTVQRIKDLITTYVKPAVEMDGGNIEFKSYHSGVVTLIMQGSCSGCPSSTVTLKQGIEGMMKRMIPEVKEVVSEAG